MFDAAVRRIESGTCQIDLVRLKRVPRHVIRGYRTNCIPPQCNHSQYVPLLTTAKPRDGSLVSNCCKFSSRILYLKVLRRIRMPRGPHSINFCEKSQGQRFLHNSRVFSLLLLHVLGINQDAITLGISRRLNGFLLPALTLTKKS